MSDKTKNIACPTCEKKGTWTPDNIYRPFCSHHCKLIDLGEWADGGYKIAGESVDIPTKDDDEE
jgi:uncharacterized protein